MPNAGARPETTNCQSANHQPRKPGWPFATSDSICWKFAWKAGCHLRLASTAQITPKAMRRIATPVSRRALATRSVRGLPRRLPIGSRSGIGAATTTLESMKVPRLSFRDCSSVFISKTTTADRYLLRSGGAVERQTPALALQFPPGFGLTDRRRRRATDEGPDLLGYPPPVGGRVKAAENRIEAKVDPLQDDVRARHVAVRGKRSFRIDETPHDRRGISRRDGNRRIPVHGLVEEPEAIHHRLGGHRRTSAEEAGALQRCPESGAIVFDDKKTDGVGKRSEIFVGEVLGQAKV